MAVSAVIYGSNIRDKMTDVLTARKLLCQSTLYSKASISLAGVRNAGLFTPNEVARSMMSNPENWGNVSQVARDIIR